MDEEPALWQRLWAYAETQDLHLDATGQSKIQTYSRTLLRFRNAVSLVRFEGLEELLFRHVADSLAWAAQVGHGASVVDVGTGAGLPGLVAGAARPDLTVDLVEPRERRVAFLREAVRAMQVQNVRVLQFRVEGLNRQEQYDEAVSRATFAPNAWKRLGQGLIRGQGVLWAMLSRDQADRLVAEDAALPEEFVHYVLPDDRRRSLWKIGHPHKA
ncbi:MAG: 16S rRNA (guanine(527)-N(7))-methyltransferase RsmG [Deltaproteobacteria bacterium]|nr:16S rRNA (guanine(527)-N(7))-methyltransferase RsmG [Deltaproteobacteria bacterium]